MLPKRRGRPTLPPGQVRHVLAALRRMLKAEAGNCSKVARTLGLSPSAVWQINAGKNKPSFETAKLIAGATGVDVMAVLDGSGNHAEIVAVITTKRKVSGRTAGASR